MRQQAGWYKGDLHCHTFHSDARGAPETLHAAAKQAGLDFLAIADHNTITQRRYFHPASSPDLVFVRAMEITTAVGHANVYGVDDWVDFRMTKPSDAHVIEQIVHRKGGLLSVNHDKPTIPWDYELPRSTARRSGNRPGWRGTGCRSAAGRSGWRAACASRPSAAATSTSPNSCSPKARWSSPAPPPCCGCPSSAKTPCSPP